MTTALDSPSEEGKRRWPPDGIYSLTGKPCTCKPECDDPCNGDCGCQACDDACQDYLSSEDSLS